MNYGPTSWYDDEAGPLVRPYALTAGRTSSARYDLDIITLVMTNAFERPGLEPEAIDIMRMCRYPQSIAEISAKLTLPIVVVKVLVTDLIDEGLVIFRSPPSPTNVEAPDKDILQAVLDGIRKL
jgi:hypothetical protein